MYLEVSSIFDLNFQVQKSFCLFRCNLNVSLKLLHYDNFIYYPRRISRNIILREISKLLSRMSLRLSTTIYTISLSNCRLEYQKIFWKKLKEIRTTRDILKKRCSLREHPVLNKFQLRKLNNTSIALRYYIEYLSRIWILTCTVLILIIHHIIAYVCNAKVLISWNTLIRTVSREPFIFLSFNIFLAPINNS